MRDGISVRNLKAHNWRERAQQLQFDSRSVNENRPGFERRQLRQGSGSEENDIINEAAGGTSDVKISKNYAFRNTTDPEINIHYAFIYGLLKTFGNPTQYQIIADSEQGKSVASKKLINFKEVTECVNGKLDCKDDLKGISAEVKQRILDIYRSCNPDYDTFFESYMEDLFKIYRQNPDVIFDRLMKNIFVNLRDRKYDNIMLNKISEKSRLVDIDLFYVDGYDNAFGFVMFKPKRLMMLSNYIDKKSEEEKNKYYNNLQKYIDKYTLDKDKINKLIKNTTEFAFGLELTAEDVINSTYNYLKHGLSETMKKIECIKWLNNESFNKGVFIAKELNCLNDEYKQSYKVNKKVVDMLLKAFNKQKEAMEQFLKKEKECKEYIGNVVNKYYKLHSIIDKVDRTHLEIEKENEKKQQEKYKKAIAWLINQHLGKPQDKQKKLYLDRKGKDGKLLNNRCFLKSKSGYIKKINREWDELLDSKMSYTEKLKNLKSFVGKLNEKEMRGCCF